MAKVEFLDTYINIASDDRYREIAYVNRYEEYRAVMSVYIYHIDLYQNVGHDFIYMDLLFCPEVNKIFIIDLYGYNFHSLWEEEVIYLSNNLATTALGQANLLDIKKILKTMYGYTTHMYNKGHLKKLQKEIIDYTRWQSQALGRWLIYDIQLDIYNRMLPKWTSFIKRIFKNRWNVYKQSIMYIDTALEFFYTQLPNLSQEEQRMKSNKNYKPTVFKLSRVTF